MSHDFVALAMPYRKELLAYATRLCQSKTLAEDIVQESLMKAMESWGRFYVPEGATPESAVRAWLYTITHNHFVTSWRKQQKSNILREELRVEAEVEVADDPRVALDGYSMEVEAALLCLDPDQRKVVVLATRGLAYKEIAAELGLPIGTVMSRLCRARRHLELALSGFAAAEYGLRRGARENANAVETTQSEESDADSVDGVVRPVADLALGS